MQGYASHPFRRGAVELAFHVQDGDGPVFVFQHGLCGDALQPAQVAPPGARHVVLDCRGHGQSAAGPLDLLSIATFAEDLAALIKGQSFGPCVIGGISMGAAIALRLAVTRPDLVRALVLARPAWICAAAPQNMEPNAHVGEMLLQAPDPAEREEYLRSPEAQQLAAEAPDNLASLSGFFDRPPRAVTAALLTRISRDGPGVTEADLAALRIPTLVIGHDRDLIHPWTHATRLAALIPGAQLVKIPAKSDDKPGYVTGFRAALAQFLHGLPGDAAASKPDPAA